MLEDSRDPTLAFLEAVERPHMPPAWWHVRRGTIASLVVTAAFFVSLFAAGGPLQQAQVPAVVGEGLIFGRVVDARTRAPLAGSVVTLGCNRASAASRGRVRTDAKGRFLFGGVANGEHQVCAERPTYRAGSVRVSVSSAPASPNLTVELAASADAVITGQVLDEGGEPVVGAQVVLLSTGSGGSGARLWQNASALTDDRGIYRIWSRDPGDYMVMMPSVQVTIPTSVVDLLGQAGPGGRMEPPELRREILSAGIASGDTRPAPTVTSGRVARVDSILQRVDGAVRPPKSSLTGHIVYPNLFYPSSHGLSGAIPVRLRPGEERTGVDFRLQPVPMIRVAGTLVGPGGTAAGIAVRLVLADRADVSADLDAAATISDSRGRFEMAAYAGEFALKVTSVSADGDVLWSKVPLSLGTASISDLTVELRRGARVSGRVEFVGTSPRPTAEELARGTVSVSTPDGHNPVGSLTVVAGFPQTKITSSGTFTTPGLPSGDYLFYVYASPFRNWTFKEALLRGRNVSDVPVQVGSSDLDGVTLVFTDQVARIDGIVLDHQVPAAESYLYLFPSDRKQWSNYGSASRRIRLGRATAKGSFTFDDVPEGGYFIVATTSPEPRDWLTPSSLERLAGRATRVDIATGQRKTVNVQVSR